MVRGTKLQVSITIKLAVGCNDAVTLDALAKSI